MKKNLRVCFIVSEINNKGPVNVVLNLSKEYVKENFEVTVITLRSSKTAYDKYFIEHGIKVINLNEVKTLNLFTLAQKLKEVLMVRSYDVIHSHGFIADCLVAFTRVKIRKVTTIHCIFTQDYIKEHGVIVGIALCLSHYLLFNLFLFDKIICCSYSVEKNFSKYIFIKNKRNINVVTNGVDQNKFYPLSIEQKNDLKNKLQLSLDKKIYIYSGRLIRRKRVPELISIFVELTTSNSILLICGEGEELDKAIKVAENNDKIIFKGFIDDIAMYYQASDYIISNSDSEGYPMSIIEGISCGCYAYLSLISSHKELINNYPDLASDLNNLSQTNKVCSDRLSGLNSVVMAKHYVDLYLSCF